MPESPPLTVIVPTGNRLDTIEDCLKSVRWADELLVIDSNTTDGTYELAKKYADRVLRHEYGFSALQKNWAIPQARCDWVLIVDTDERVSAQLQNEIRSVIQDQQSPLHGYKLPRINYILGRPVMHTGYYPDYQLRLFMRDYGRYDLRRVHAHLNLDGSFGFLKTPLIHYAHRTMDQTLQNLLIQMTTWESEQRSSQPRLFWFNMTARPLGAFVLRYFRQGGWRDGYHGLVVSLLWSMYVSITYMKIWEKDLGLDKTWWVDDWNKSDHGNP